MKSKIKIIKYIDPNKPMVALTFDDGPSPEYTAAILKALEENDAKATFFILGMQVEFYPDILQQIAEGGHEIGNHSFSHLNFTNLVESALDYQVLTTQEIIRKETGTTPTLLRPPYGSINEEVRKIDMPIILWSIDPRDWQSRNPDVIYDRVLHDIKDGDIVLMHDTYQSSAEAAQRIIPELKRRGYQLVTVSELAEARGISLNPGEVYRHLYPLQE